MNIRFTLATAALIATLSGCASNDTSTSSANYASAESLAAFRTYAWSPKRSLTLRDPSLNTGAVRGRIEAAVEAEMATKGFTKTSPDTADLLVNYAAASRSMVSSQEFTGHGELSESRLDEEGGSSAAFAPRGTIETDYEQGRLLLDLTDRRNGKVVYRGSTQTVLLKQPTPAKSASRINRMVKEMLKDLPKR